MKKRPLRVSSRESTAASVCIIRAATTNGADLAETNARASAMGANAIIFWIMPYVRLRAQLTRLETVAAFLAGHHPGDTGPGGSSKGPCAIAGMFGCAPAAASEEYGSVSFCEKAIKINICMVLHSSTCVQSQARHMGPIKDVQQQD